MGARTKDTVRRVGHDSDKALSPINTNGERSPVFREATVRDLAAYSQDHLAGSVAGVQLA